MILLPAYGRDYKNAKAVLADWEAQKDFIIADVNVPWSGKPINRSQLEGKEVKIRYNNKTKFIWVTG